MRAWRSKNQDRNREYNNAANKRWNRKNPEKRRAINKRHADKLKAIVDAAKLGPCVDCGGHFPPAAMDLHHRDQSLKEFSVGSYRGSEARLLLEIEKCDLLCACCHRTRDHGPPRG